MRFSARETAIVGQPEVGFGLIPGAGALQHLTRLMGLARALKAVLSGQDYDADLAERYGWINRALPAKELDGFVSSLAQRVAAFPTASLAILKERVNAIGLAPAADFRRDAELFVDCARSPETQARVQAAMKRGFQTSCRTVGKNTRCL
jgi:enoyl-CoA hydratase/carnithine racemase